MPLALNQRNLAPPQGVIRILEPRELQGARRRCVREKSIYSTDSLDVTILNAGSGADGVRIANYAALAMPAQGSGARELVLTRSFYVGVMSFGGLR